MAIAIRTGSLQRIRLRGEFFKKKLNARSSADAARILLPAEKNCQFVWAGSPNLAPTRAMFTERIIAKRKINDGRSLGIFRRFRTCGLK